MPVLKIAEFIPEHFIYPAVYPNPTGQVVQDNWMQPGGSIPGSITYQVLRNEWVGLQKHVLEVTATLPAAAVGNFTFFQASDSRTQNFGFGSLDLVEVIAKDPSITFTYFHMVGTIQMAKTATGGTVPLHLRWERTLLPSSVETFVPTQVTINQDHIPMYVGFALPDPSNGREATRVNMWDKFDLTYLVVPAGTYTVPQYKKFFYFSEGSGSFDGHLDKVYYVEAQKNK